MNSKLDAREITVIYRVYYKLMKTTIAPKAITASVKGVTRLMEANQEHSTTFVPRLLKWNDILTDEEWKFDSITNPSPLQPETTQIDRVIQFPDGSINLKFLRSNSFSQASSSRRMSSARLSSFYPRDEEDNSSKPEQGKIHGVDFSKTIRKVYYEETVGSPTASEMKPIHRRKDSIGVLTSSDKFIPDKKLLHAWWKAQEHKHKVEWYKDTYTLEQRISFSDKWVKDMQ
ncbi:hypothetical protein R3W88_019564 [Solanum pinnatisectum]|uniref:Uncharacterized protein n=1 Tax=Solanum pinnatisectum TaxID=50273 RepID=A0AAV9KKN1_9SOLN|nr:hypothetical protein R3W88_019564 [Solanum pinnatisectum]